MPAKREDSSTLISLFTEYGLEAFISSTRALMILISDGGKLLVWNRAFDAIKDTVGDSTFLRDFLSLSSRSAFDLLLSTVTHDRVETQGELDFGKGNGLNGYTCFLYPVPDARVLFIAEPTHAVSDLETVSAELQRTKLKLERKETELQAVLAQAHEVSHTDALTFLPNRRQIMVDLQNAVTFSDRYGTPLTISMLDIDHFKKINDTHGHTVGDEVLRSLAGKLRQHIRHPDTIGRYGGEEFLIVLPHSTIKAATEQAQRLCEQVRALPITVGDQTLSMTISIGVAQYKIHKEDWQTFLTRADGALYQAKNKGRDQWVVDE
ncbi:MAG TPA: GGDEF domain-containing protein [Anaerolineales bacterium]|nr:GGDEF domain-containing protein [Anaerolineales bacterium]